MLLLVTVNGRPRALRTDTFTLLPGGGWFSCFWSHERTLGLDRAASADRFRERTARTVTRRSCARQER